MKELSVNNLKPGTSLTETLWLDNLFIVSTSPCHLSEKQINALKNWNFETVYTDSSSNIDTKNENGKLDQAAATIRKISSQNESISLSSFMDDKKPVIENVTSFTEKIIEKPKIKIPIPTFESSFLHPVDESKKIIVAQTFYNEYMKYINAVYTHYATHGELDQKDLSEAVLKMCNFIRENTKYILRIQPSLQARNKNFLVSHSMRCTVLSISIGIQLNLSTEKLVELGITSILHEIGQIRLPPQLYMNDKALTPSEQLQMKKHPILGYKILQKAGFPLSIQLGVLEHHERETGTGYPQHLTGERITLYAKIIAVACSFEAITAPRHFKEARTTYEAMIEMLKNEQHQYDDNVVRALLYCLSLYPIGSYVYLSNGRVAQVIDINPASPKNPIVHIIGDIDDEGVPRKIQTDDSMIKITRAMNKKEADDVLAALTKNQEK